MSQFAQTSQKTANNQFQTSPVKWAQSSECIYLTIAVANVKNPVVEITSKKVMITFESESKSFKSDLDLFHEGWSRVTIVYIVYYSNYCMNGLILICIYVSQLKVKAVRG